jgi:hypothetical protein
MYELREKYISFVKRVNMCQKDPGSPIDLDQTCLAILRQILSNHSGFSLFRNILRVVWFKGLNKPLYLLVLLVVLPQISKNLALDFTMMPLCLTVHKFNSVHLNDYFTGRYK